MSTPIVVPDGLMPRLEPGRDCPCMKRPVNMTVKKGVLTWLVAVGDAVQAGQILCEGEADKKTVEIAAPCSGTLLEKLVEDECVFRAGDILGTIG